MTPPWRTQDLADHIKGVDTRPQATVELLTGIDLGALAPDADYGYVILWPSYAGSIQPVVWPMVLHAPYARA